MLELRGVSRSLGRDPLLSRADLDFTTDTPTAVLGLSVSARAAFLRLLAGADKPHAGTVRLGGQDIAQARRERGRIVRIGSKGVKPSGQRVRKLVGDKEAERVRLSGRLDAAVSDLDLDQRVRLAIAMARQERPGLILLESPAAELEFEIRDRFVADLKQMLAGAEAVVVLAGAPDEALGLAGRIVVLAGGKVVQAAEAETVFARPANLAAALASSHPALNVVQMDVRAGAGRLADGSLFQPPDGVALPVEGACTLAFRPDDTALARSGAGCVRFVVRATGEEIVVGGRRYARVMFAGSALLALQPAAGLAAAGMLLNVFVDRARLLVFNAAGQAAA